MDFRLGPTDFRQGIRPAIIRLTLFVMLLYAITDSRRLVADPKDLPGRTSALVRLAGQWAEGGVDAIQIREKDLEAGALERLTTAVFKEIEGSNTHVYVNGHVDVALAAGAEVHLPSIGSLAPSEVRRIAELAGLPAPRISISCHTVEEVQQARLQGVTLALFAPIFGKQISLDPYGTATTTLPGLGLEALSAACRAATPVPVVALGGITAENAPQCLAAGAAGIAAIRLFLGSDWHRLRA